MKQLPRVFTASNLVKGIIVLLISYGFIFLTSCGAYKRRIIAENCFSKEVDTAITIDTTITTDSNESTFQVNCDSLRLKYDSLANASKDSVVIHDTILVEGKQVYKPKKGVLIHSDSIADIYYSINANGNISFKVKTKPQKQKIVFTKPVKVSTPCPTFSLNWFQKNAMNFFWLLVIIGLWQLVKTYLYRYLNKG